MSDVKYAIKFNDGTYYPKNGYRLVYTDRWESYCAIRCLSTDVFLNLEPRIVRIRKIPKKPVAWMVEKFQCIPTFTTSEADARYFEANGQSTVTPLYTRKVKP